MQSRKALLICLSIIVASSQSTCYSSPILRNKINTKKTNHSQDLENKLHRDQGNWPDLQRDEIKKGRKETARVHTQCEYVSKATMITKC
jgi:hypothetical protein